MFGFVVANGKALSEEQKSRYRGCYCGLCRALQRRCGELCRMTLSYDMTFLVLLLTGMYEPEETASSGRCAVHPVKPRPRWSSRFTDYAADMSVALAYYNCLDDYEDDGKRLALAGSKLLKRHYDAVSARWPKQIAVIERSMAELSALEKARCPEPDAAADCFARLLGELFAVEEDTVWQPRLRSFGEKLGRLIYMMDACVDIERDRKKGSYNPLLCTDREMEIPEREQMLKMLAGDCAAEFEALPIVQDVDILRNVLYSGIWSQFTLRGQGRRKGETTDG